MRRDKGDPMKMDQTTISQNADIVEALIDAAKTSRLELIQNARRPEYMRDLLKARLRLLEDARDAG